MEGIVLSYQTEAEAIHTGTYYAPRILAKILGVYSIGFCNSHTGSSKRLDVQVMDYSYIQIVQYIIAVLFFSHYALSV